MPKTINVEAIGRVCHEANRAYCESVGDDSQPAWDDAPDWQRRSMAAGVAAVIEGTARTAEEQHQAWCDEKVKDDWRYGPVKDAERKTHPCLVPYSELPPEQKRKDHLFRAVVQALTSDI